MKLQYYTKEILIVGLSIALYFSVKSCKSESHLKNSANTQLTTKTTYFKNKLGTQTATIQTLEVDKNTLNSTILKQDDSLKKLASEFANIKAIIKWKTKFVFDTINVQHEVLIPCDFTTYGGYKTDTINFNYKIDKTSLSLTDINIPNETTLITGFKRKWFLGKQTLTTDITNSNPMFKTDNVKSIEVVIPKPFYDTRLFNIGVGVIGGFLLAK